MDGLSGASSVIAVIDISTKIALLCFQYSTAVKDTKDDIERVQRKVGDITHILEKIKQLLDSQDKALLSTTQDLFSSLEQCREELKSLEAKLAPGKTRKTMSRFGFHERETWLQAFREVVGSIVVLESPLSATSLARLLQVPQEEIQCRRDPLHSVLSVLDKKDAPIRLLHLSFREFLLDHQKQGKSPFWVDEKRTHQKLVSRCLKLMSRSGGLHQNMCGLPGPGLLRSEVDEQIVATRLPPDLQYACRYWVDHLKQSGQGIVDGDATHLFLQKHLLYWLEAMSLVRESSRCVNLLDSLRVLASPSAKLVLGFPHDAKRFVLRFQSVLIDAPLQVYYSALVFAPERSLIRQTFVDQVPEEVKMLSMREADWDACRSTLEGHFDQIMAVAFSPDGQLIALASQDSTVQLWEVATGMCCSTLDSPSQYIFSVDFSPDGQ
ncbi:hypothetical protein HBH98_255990, partial [Parastagonospora nodorum]